MGLKEVILFAILCASACGSPRIPDESPFARSAIETIPEHDPLAPPIRSSVESIPLRSLADEGDGRLPLRDAVEKRPIPVLDPEIYYKYLDDNGNENDVETFIAMKNYYGAASHLNNGSKAFDELVQQGNANLQEMHQSVSGPFGRRLVVCYMESWSAYRPPPLAFTAGLIPKSCTHLHYAFAVLHPHTYAVIPANEDYDIIKGGYRIATGLKRRIPGLRVIISVGGDGTERLFSEMIQEPYRRNSFIESAISFLQENDFDGLDLHWVYAGDNELSSSSEKELLTTFLYELRERFSSYGFLLSTVLPPFRYQIEDGYDLSAVSGAADYTVLQAWDMTHARRDRPPAHAVQHSTLHRDPGAPERDQRFDNIEFMVKYILRHGMAADKLVLGIPMFGRSYTLAASTAPTPGAPVVSWGEEGPYTQMKGLLSYFEICMSEREGRGSSASDEAGNAYALFENQWVGYDTPSIVEQKMKFVRSFGLAGAAAWAIDMDDFRGLCGKPYPLLSAISTGLNGEATLSDQSSLKSGVCEPNTSYLASDEVSCAHFHFCTGGVDYKMVCEDEKLYDPSTGFCGHQDVTKCVPGQSLRISVEDAARFLSQAYENDYELTTGLQKDINKEPERLVTAYEADFKRGKESNKRVVCYMTNWAFYRRGDSKFVPEQVDTRLCTHVVYAYATLAPDDLVAKEFDPWADITHNLYERVTSLKDVKVLLGLGGWTDSAGDKYSRLVSSPAARTKFTQKLVQFLRAHNFKGLHLDWNYPVCWQSNCKKGAKSDKANFAELIKEVSKSLHAADMELGVALSGYKEVIESAYDLPAISDAADFMSAMTYDYHGGWERTTAHHTPLRPLKKEPLPYYSVEFAVNALLTGGVDPKKLLLGLAFYGQSYRLADTDEASGPGAAAAGPGEPGEFTKQPGMLAYYEICYRVKNLRWKTGRQDNAGPFAYSDNQWVGYDDQKSVAEKVEWAMQKGLGGVTAWAVDLDDFSNRCCTEPSPLLRAAGRALGRAVPAPPAAPCERPPDPITPLPPTTTPAESDGAPGDHGNHNHNQHTSTTWPSWSPSSTQSTTQTWWPQSTTPITTTTTTPRPTTTTTRTTTTRRTTTSTTTTTTTTTQAPQIDDEGSSCEPGEYHGAPGDCEGYLQCEAGRWRKHRCAPGLHWSAKANRCDWPSFAKCTATASTTERPAATTTLAPTTARPPPRPTTTTTTVNPILSDDEINAGAACFGEAYEAVPGDCGAYYRCEGGAWRVQRCAPGLHWSAAHKHCDWPKYAVCLAAASSQKPTTTTTTSTTTTTTTTTTTPRPTRPPTTSPTPARPSGPQEGGACGPSDVHAPAPTCESYLLCVSGVWRRQRCPSGLHWDKRTNRCDWIDFAMCEVRKKPVVTTKAPVRQPATVLTPTKRPVAAWTSTRKPQAQYQKPTRCVTGTYHPHPRCEKFYVCVNGVLVMQGCAPGLVWSRERAQCDFPGVANMAACTDRRQGSPTKPNALLQVNDEDTPCENGHYAKNPVDCSRYLHCLFGKYEQFSCSPGLHWNQNKQICDWPNDAQCKIEQAPTTTTTQTSVLDSVDDVQEVAEELPTTAKPTVELIDVEFRPELLKTDYKVVCYYTNWAWYRPGLGKYGPEDIDPSLCTHIVYGFAVLGQDGLIEAYDPYADLENRFYERVVEYKKYGIKVSIAIGGWKDSAGDKYSVLVNNPQSRARFVADVLQFVEKYGFDGLDLDWEYPKCWQVDCSKGPDSDKQAFADLVRELSAVFKPRGLLLSSAVSPSKMVIDAGYDVPALARDLDWIAVMTYDYHGQWDRKTGHVAPLFYHPEDDTTYFNANYTIHYWMQRGAPASRLVMGIPLYGQSFSTVRMRAGLNAPATAAGLAGEYTRANGFLAYHEICERIKNRNWVVVQDPHQRMGPYAHKGDQWVSFDDLNMIKKKVNFIKSLKLGGGMVWALDLDDFRNRCKQGRYPLMNAIKDTFLDTNSEYEVDKPKPVSPIQSDELDDIQVRPSSTRPPPVATTPVTTQVTTQMTTPMTTQVVMDEPTGYKIVCYYTNWAWYRPDSGKYTPSDIEPSLCTHVVYAFAVLDGTRLIVKPHDNWLDVENKFYEKVVALKKKGVKVSLGLGGWNDSAGDKYSRLVNNPTARRKFIFHVLDFLEQYEFDGLDLDWEYPRCWQVDCEKGPSSDKEGFASLVIELRAAFIRRGLLLSAAVSASKRVINLAYDVPVLANNLDWISLMTYDYHGQWDERTGHVAPMYVHDTDDDRTFNVNYTVHYWIEKGAPPQKLVMGIPFYGQSFSLSETSENGLGAPTYAGGEGGDETRARGFLAFYEICERIRIKGWKVFRDPSGQIGPYATRDDQWVSFDDDVMVRHKAEYVRAMGLGGGMVWALDLDDFRGQHCGCGRAPLLRTIHHVLRQSEPPPSCPLYEVQSPSPPSTEVTVTTNAEPNDLQVQVQDTPDTETQEETDSTTLEGRSCTGAKFQADPADCRKYYLCLNGQYMQLSCPSTMVWNKNHCDMADNAACGSKANLKMSEGSGEPLNTIVACYFTNWAFYRNGSGSFGPEQVDSSLCTHVVYSWAHLDGNNTLVPSIPELDVTNDFYGKLTELKNKGVKVIIGAGGIENSEDDRWSAMAASADGRSAFVKSVLKFLKKWKFDGIQIAWQYPVCKQAPCEPHDSSDRDNFSILLAHLAVMLRHHNFELSALVAADPRVADAAYDAEVLVATVDWLSVAANDYYDTSSRRTSYILPLGNTDGYDNNIETSLNYWASVVPSWQLVVGVPAYARCYTLRSELAPGLGAAVAGPGRAGRDTGVPGFLAHYEICSTIKSEEWKVSNNPEGTYAVRGAQWASYLTPEEVHRVAVGVTIAGLRGGALWAFDLDDWRADCACRTQPLLYALRQGLYEPELPLNLCS